MGMTVIDHLAFPDHVHYTPAMMDDIRARARAGGADVLVATEKDADKVAPYLTGADVCWAVRLGTKILSGEDRLEVLLRLDQEQKQASHA